MNKMPKTFCNKIYILINERKIMNQKEDYAREFDESVVKYNEWLDSLEDLKVQRKNNWRAFFRGMAMSLDIFGGLFKNDYLSHNHPLYSCDDLSSKQKDAIALASYFQRVGKSLDEIILGKSRDNKISAEEAKSGKLFTQKIYNSFRDVYISHAANQ